MNTLTGKSVGIALFLAAALIAALFAMGVFAPAGVDAGVKRSPAAMVELSTYKPGATGVMLTAKFHVTDEVDGSQPGGAVGDNVVINLPAGITGLDRDNVKVMQGTSEVGGVAILLPDGNALTSTTEVTITTPNAMSTATPPGSIVREKDTDNGNLMANTETTLTITGLSITSPAVTSGNDFTIHQVPESVPSSEAAAGFFKTINYTASVTSAMAMLDKKMAGDENVKLTLTFRADTHSTGPADNPVTIMLPVGYDLATDDGIADGATTPTNAVIAVDAGYTGSAGTDSKISVSPSGAVVTTTTTDNPGSDPVVEVAETLTVHSFGSATSNPTVTVTISGLMNPSGTQMLNIGFWQGGTEAQKTAMVYVTDGAEIGLMDSEGDPGIDISSIEASDTGVTLAFNFMPVVDPTDDDPIVIALNDGFVYPDHDDSWWGVWQMVGGEKMYRNARFSFDSDRTNVELRLLGSSYTRTNDDGSTTTFDPATEDAGNIYVEFRNLTNPNMVGSLTLATVTQPPYESVSAMTQMTGTEISTTTAGAPVRIKVTTKAAATIPPGDDIVVKLKDFVVPATIPVNQVIIDGAEDDDPASTPGDDYDGNPSAISISGTTVNLSIPTTRSNGEDILRGITMDSFYTITFKLGAGIKNPNVKQGSRSASAGGEGTGAGSTEVTSKVSAVNAEDPKRGANASRGDRVTFKVIGLKTGSATLYLFQGRCVDALLESQGCVDHTGDPVLDSNGNQVAGELPNGEDFRIGGELQADGSVAVERRVTSRLFQANEVSSTNPDGGPREFVGTPPALVGTNIIYSVDGTGVLSDAHGRLAIEPVVDLGTQSIKQGGLLELDVADWYYGPITKVEVGGVLVNEMWVRGAAAPFQSQGVGGDGETEFIVVMPPGIRLGEQQLKLTGTTVDEQAPAGVVDSFTTKITVDPLDLTIDSATATSTGMAEVAVNQEFTIDGSGFTTADNAHIVSVKFGDVVLRETTAGVCVACSTGERVVPDTAGNFSATFRLEPRFGAERLKVGEYRVEVKDSEGRIGQVDAIVPEPVVQVTPDESRRGSTLTVVGSKFPAGAELAVEIKYGLAGNERVIGAATPDSSGNWRTTFTVPTTAVIGEDHNVLATPIEEAFNHFKGKGVHRLPEQEVIVTPSVVASGGRMTLEGHNMPLFTVVRINMANISLLGREGIETDGVGSFTIPNVLVPQLEPGFHTVEAQVATQGGGFVSVRTTVQVADIVTRPTDEVFEELIDAEILASVWRYNIDETGSDWDSFDPQYAGQPGINDLQFVSTNDIVWIRVTENTMFQGAQLFAGWNLRTLE